MKKLFNPEFINRIDETIVFRNLDREDIKKIILIEMKDLIKNLGANKMLIELDQSAADFLADKGFDQKFGARPLKRAIQKYVEDPLAEELLMNTFKEGDKILVAHDAIKDVLIFTSLNSSETSTQDNEEKQKV